MSIHASIHRSAHLSIHTSKHMYLFIAWMMRMMHMPWLHFTCVLTCWMQMYMSQCAPFMSTVCGSTEQNKRSAAPSDLLWASPFLPKPAISSCLIWCRVHSPPWHCPCSSLHLHRLRMQHCPCVQVKEMADIYSLGLVFAAIYNQRHYILVIAY